MANTSQYDGLQRTFSKEYAAVLKYAVKQGKSDTYLADEFSYKDEDNNVYRLQGLMHHNVVLDPEKSDFENAVAFYEAYKDLSPLIASEEAFWAYLTHVEHYEYVKKRWRISSESSAESIIDHFFVTSMIKIARNGVARMWWPVHLTIDLANESNPYHLTQILFERTDIMQMLSESKLFSCKNLICAILRFLRYNDIPQEDWAHVNRYIIRYYNSVGGVRKLTYLSEDYFMHELDRNKQILKNLPKAEKGVHIPLKWN